MTTTNKLAPLRLTNPTTAQPQCPACGKFVKNMGRHAGTAACKNASREAMIARLGLVEVWWRERDVLLEGVVSVVVIRKMVGTKDKRHFYAAPEPVAAMRALRDAGLDEKSVARLLRGPKEEIERELALVALAGKQQETVMIPMVGAASAHAAVAPLGTFVQPVARSR